MSLPMSSRDVAKRRAARRALEFVEDGMVVGLGSGTTATMFIQELGTRVAEGLQIRAIASSLASEQLARSLHIDICEFQACSAIDLTVDGADEVAPGLALIKGGGGALLREKIVASASRQFVIVADSAKEVTKLGAFPLPIAVVPMAAPLVARRLEAIGLRPKRRQSGQGGDYITDEGNLILDCSCGQIEAPDQLASEIRGIVGVVEHGLFLRMATLALVADEHSVRERLT